MNRQQGQPPTMDFPSPPATVHFIGIGGVSMSGLALMLQDRGYAITGSDSTESKTVIGLRDAGMKIVIGHDNPGLVSRADVVVGTPRAMESAETELSAASRAGIPIVRRGQLLGHVANAYRLIAVAGTHGKSTTSGMIATALVRLGIDPSYSIGGTLPGLRNSTDVGSGDVMVVEADEFDRAMLWLLPEISVITSVSWDHPDIYPDEADYEDAFLAFAHNTRPGGTLVIAADDPGCQRVLDRLGDVAALPFRVVTFGTCLDADWRLNRLDDGWEFADSDGRHHRAHLSVPGRHNARNAIAATAAMVAAGVDASYSIDALEPFTGVGRRFEHKGTASGVDVVDDYAHHPEEIAAVVAAAREHYPERRVVAVHQPHTYSRTKSMLDGFARSLDLADEVVLLSVYPSGETDTLGISSDDLRSRIQVPSVAASGPEDAAIKAASVAKPGDVVLTLGAGDITLVGDLVLARLEQEQAGGRRVSGRSAGRVAGGARSATLPDGPEAGASIDDRMSRSPATRRRSPAGSPSGETVPDAPHLKVMRDASMSLYTTMRAGGPADLLVRAGTPDDLLAINRWARERDFPVTVIGGGSNLLVGDDGIRGLVIVARTPGERAKHLLVAEDGGDIVRVTVGAQAPLSWVGRYCAEQGWAGMDWGVGLPGQIGGATVNNAGAHGTELKDYLVEIELLLENGDVVRQPSSWLEPSYRMTRIKGAPRPRPWIVLRSVFDLPKGDSRELVALADDHADFRKRTQPTGPCSGSTFANPPGDFAGRLLEVAGFKGFAIGGMQFSEKHANWVVNTGTGTAFEAWELIQHARQAIFDRFGIELDPEVERIGEPW